MNSPTHANGTVFCFDDVVVDGANYRVSRDGREVNLAPRAFDVLTYLIAERGHVVDKQQIFDAIWKDTFVSDQALTKVIKDIRHALDDPAHEPRYIETVPKRGYRFIGEVSDTPSRPTGFDPPSERPVQKSRVPALVITLIFLAALATVVWLLSRPTAAPVDDKIRTVAVLPFKPLDSSSRNESLEIGMAETLITQLSNLQRVAVRPMRAVSRYTGPEQDPIEVGREIGVETVINGSIQKADDRIRVTVRLTDVPTGRTVWSDHFDESFTDIFKVQDSIAERVSSALALQLTSSERERLAKHYTENQEAYQLYLNAQLVWNGRRQNWIEQSLSLYKQAVEKDPNFALAYIGMADAYIMLNGHHRMAAAETVSNARPVIMMALEIDSTLAQAHNALAELQYQYDFDWSGAESEFRKAIDLNPNVAWIRQAFGWYLMSSARFDEAAAEMELAHELDPSSLTINVGRGRLMYYSRQYDRAIQHFQNMIAVEPNDPTLFRALYTIYVMNRMYPDAVETFLKYLELTGIASEKRSELRVAFQTDGWEGFLGKRLEWQGNIPNQGAEIADLYIGLGMKDRALDSLEHAVDARNPAAVQLKIEPAYDDLQSDPRFTELLRKINLFP